TEATIGCIGLGRALTRRDKTFKIDGGYHGHADALLVKAGSGALTHGRPDSAGLPQAFVDLTISLPFNDANRVRKCFAQNKAQIAAVIVEPVPANSGLYFPTDNFLSVLREECTRNGALLIFDEVITGFRVARGGAQEIYGVKSDLTALGKIIGGGFPVGAFGGRAEIMDQLSPDGPVYQAGTLSGNPLAMAAGLAQLREREGITGWKLLNDLGDQFEKLARDAIKFAAANPSRGGHAKIDVTFHRLGSMFCLFFAAGPVVDLASAQRSDLKMFARFFHACLKHGVYFAPSQFETGFISTVHTAEDIERTGAIIREALENLR